MGEDKWEDWRGEDERKRVQRAYGELEIVNHGAIASLGRLEAIHAM